MRQTSAPAIALKHIVAAVLAFVLLTGAIVSTSTVAQLSYQAAQLQQQEQQLNLERQYLQEQLADAHALTTSMAYAEEHGFSQLAQAQTELDVTPSLAQAR